MDSPSSSDLEGSVGARRTGRSARRALVVVACLASALVWGAGCVTVRPSDKEFLSDPSMTFGNEGTAGAHEQHVTSNREGSFGAGAVTGGGCGCN